MFDHIGVNVRDYAASRAFYERALSPLGYGVVVAFDEWKAVGFGEADKPTFWVAQREPYTSGAHVAFAVDERATVDAFHEAALDAGGIDNGSRGSARSTTRTTTAHSSTTSTATTSRRCATARLPPCPGTSSRMSSASFATSSGRLRGSGLRRARRRSTSRTSFRGTWSSSTGRTTSSGCSSRRSTAGSAPGRWWRSLRSRRSR